MTRNLYLGSALTSTLAGANLDEIPGIVTQIWSTVLATDFPQRARAIADEIEATAPHLVGLQEATLYRRQSPGDVLAGNPVQAGDIEYDFLEILLSELNSRELTYDAVVVREYSDVELPMLGAGGGLDDIRLTDRDAILVRSDVVAENPRSGLFAANLSLDVGGVFALNVVRGWTALEATVHGVRFHFWNTHLETQEEGPMVQLSQAQELLLRLPSDEHPLVVVGDFNSAADGSTTPTYATLLAGGLLDAWSLVRGTDPGYTCCQAPDLTNPVSLLNRRLDLVLFRSEAEALTAVRVGGDPTDRTAPGLWPSDHAGVVAGLRLRAP